jgi:hypothetical protein
MRRIRMRRLVLLLTSAAVVVVMVMASTNTAAAQGNPHAGEGVLPVPPAGEGSAIDDTTACDLGQGGTRGTDLGQGGTRAHGLLESEVGIGATTCFVPLPAQALEPGEEF